MIACGCQVLIPPKIKRVSVVGFGISLALFPFHSGWNDSDCEKYGTMDEGIQQKWSCDEEGDRQLAAQSSSASYGDSLCEADMLRTSSGRSEKFSTTVSAVPRSKTVTHFDPKPSHLQGTYKTSYPMHNGMSSHGRILYYDNETESSAWRHQSDIDHRNSHSGFESPNRAETDDEKEKKKEKKWTLGGLFRRKSKKDGDDSSEDSADDGKRGFLSRRKSKRERRRLKTRNTANGFDVVIPQHKDSTKNGEISVEQLWGGQTGDSTAPVRYIHRHPETAKKTNSLQVPKHSRRDSRSSGGSDHTDGRRGRKEVMARAEAKRDLMRDESSSDEYESYHSNSSLNRINGDGRRQRRPERHKRLSQDEDIVTKSDLEGRRLPPNCRWISRTYYPDSSDHDVMKANLMNHSGTPSPCRSPRARQKQLLQYMMMQNSHPMSTFPPGAHHPHLMPANHQPKENHIGYRNQIYRTNRNSEYHLPRSLSTSDNANRKTLMDYEQYLNSCGTAKEKSLSYDQNIHKASLFENEHTGNNYPVVSRRLNRPEIYNQSPQHPARTQNGLSETRKEAPTVQQRSIQQQSFTPSESDFQANRSNSYQHIPAYHPRVEAPPSSHLNGSPSVLRYYADQNPRSRNPIHITCNPTSQDQPYLSDSQMMVKPVQTASDFWKLRDQELMRQKKPDSSLKPPQSKFKSERSRSNSPRAGMKQQEKVCNGFDSADKKVLKEEYNAGKLGQKPPDPPVRRLSKQEVLARLQKCQQLNSRPNELKVDPKTDSKTHNANLDEALNELETIYNSLRLKDEDLVDRAERRDLPVFRPKNPITSVSVRDKIQNFYAEADYPKSSDSVAPNAHQRAVPLRRSGVPDKTTDDMAFRRLNQKDRTDLKPLPAQSYLRTSPAVSPVPFPNPALRKDSPVLEPDITYDDVVFRNIRHANSTLKVHDPQPPFGIPIGVISPASNSDYLHATPTERFRPTFTSSKTPDVVKDDLAFRNLRKDNRTNAALDPVKNDLKKRAVRSLSANLYNIMQRENSRVSPEANSENSCEKTQSLTDLTKGKQGLEKRLKELKEEKNAKRAEFFELSKKQEGEGSVCYGEAGEGSESRAQDAGKKLRSPVVELSRYPAAAPTSSLQGNPFKEPSLDDDQLESLLSALAKEAEIASKDLERQLDELETRKAEKEAEDEKQTKVRAIEEFNRKFKAVDKGKRRRNLSLSSANEPKDEERKTGSLERRKKMKELPSFEDLLRGRTKPDRKLSDAPGTASHNFEMVTDLSQILHDVEVQQQLNNEVGSKETNHVFQEVYEYNCRLSTEERRRSAELSAVVKQQQQQQPHSPSLDVETEFEKLHEEVEDQQQDNSSVVVDELMADIGSVDQSGSGSYSSFPFPLPLGLPEESRGSLSGSGRSDRRDDSRGEGILQEIVWKSQQRSS